ncbi:MAG: hypothetical protein ABIP38_02660 [Steroidobacteraceae bacterium]
MKRHIAIVAALAIAGTITGCGGSDSGSAPGPGGGGGGTPTPSAMDTFFTAVKSLISTSDDTAQPAAMDGYAATTPEDTAPEAIY